MFSEVNWLNEMIKHGYRVIMVIVLKYENAKYRDSPHYKAAKLWDTLPRNILDTGTLTELKILLKIYFSPSNDTYFESSVRQYLLSRCVHFS